MSSNGHRCTDDGRVILPGIDAVDCKHSAGCWIKPAEQAADGCLSRPNAADDANAFAGRYRKPQTVEDLVLGTRIDKIDASEAKTSRGDLSVDKADGVRPVLGLCHDAIEDAQG